MNFKSNIFFINLFVILFFVFGCSNPNIGTNDVNDETSVTIDNPNSDAAPSWPVVQTGDNSLNTKAIQYFLKHRGYSITVDGAFGSGTATVVKSFQSANGLTADGIVGSATWTKLIVQVQSGSSGEAVKAVQDLLKNKFGYSLTVDGAFGSGTTTAVKSFQSSNGLGADGIVGPTTWQYIIGKTTTDFWAARKSSWVFPVKGGNVLDPNGASRYFGASRDGGARAHAGADLVPVNGPGTQVIAMTSGTVLNYYLFYAGTYALEVKNDDGTIARYTEISSSLRAGARVAKAQVIGTIIRNTSAERSYMLHLEVYMGTSTGGLTNTSNYTYNYVPYKNYQRRSDLLNPMGVMQLPISY
ncbi:MAG: hypothetical protein A2086_05030 [Spirochaetes bacterium GWD1_27_9]|nr:MAG: hypothetical protein A2Z98_10615 [Spirochaetes bacterium GWB1_27_13]OHD26222.1 MAG: hypothetical protein A2Y34_11190 [Spirochaetes bacterium GWC1_27_15]OHD44583.1 MAG: hypothetical protein A2086_05030 [Spirochaetes bacterium GWD1_27_9]